MAGTDEAVASDEDALYVLTAVLLTPAQFPSVLGDDYPEACAALGLVPLAEGYGLVLGQDSDGARWTVVVDDVSLVAVAIASWDCGMEYDLSPDERTVVAALPGWPVALAVCAPNVPEPHDPEPDPDAEAVQVLSPPDTSDWGPAQRRLGADEVALQWANWRAQIDDENFVRDDAAGTAAKDASQSENASPPQDAPRPEEAEDGRSSEDAEVAETGEDSGDGDGDEAPDGTTADASPEPGASPEAEDSPAAAEDPGTSGDGDDSSPATARPHPGIHRALGEARAYVDSPPPPGRVRSAFATDRARTLRADGPGWSLVARTDDIAFILLDEEPGEVLPVGRGPELPGLLASLDNIAVRPS